MTKYLLHLQISDSEKQRRRRCHRRASVSPERSSVFSCRPAQLHTVSVLQFRATTLASGGLSEVSSEAACSHEGAHVTERVAKLTWFSVTRKNAECCGFTGSKCFNAVFLIHTSRNSILCASVSRKQNQLAKRSKVQQKTHQECFHAVCKTQNRDLPPNGPFSQILSHIMFRVERLHSIHI